MDARGCNTLPCTLYNITNTSVLQLYFQISPDFYRLFSFFPQALFPGQSVRCMAGCICLYSAENLAVGKYHRQQSQEISDCRSRLRCSQHRTEQNPRYYALPYWDESFIKQAMAGSRLGSLPLYFYDRIRISLCASATC